MSTPDAERLASEARRLLDEPLLKAALAEVERQSVEDVLTAGTDQARREHVDTVLTIRKLRAKLELVIATGRASANPVAIA